MNTITGARMMAISIATLRNPWLLRRLALCRDRHCEAGCTIGDLGPIIIVGAGDTLSDVEAAAGCSISAADAEYCEGDHGWYELAFVTSDDGSGAILFIPDREGIDPALLAIVRAFNAAGSASTDIARTPDDAGSKAG